MKRVLHALIAASFFVSAMATTQPARAYSTSWTKAQALDYAGDALYERYVYGGAKFRNNNYWDSDEGLDCSGYVAKVWAVDRYTYPMTFYHPYSTYNFYYGFPYGVFKDRTTAQLLNAWVYRASTGGPSDHMGLFISRNSDGTWRVYEARGASYGVIAANRSISTLISYNYRRTDRKNWSYS
jgi:hypothetical protein